MSNKIALIDGYGFVFRAYHSLPPLTRNDGTPVGAVFGFTNMLIKLLASLDVSHIAVVFDSGSKTFRNEIFPEYKANRPPCPEDLIPQFPIIREAAESLNIAILEKIGFEADDIIATLAKKHAAQGDSVLIVSSDKDLMQLIDERVLMYDAMKNKMITAKEVEEKFFVTPNKVLDVLSLMGDASDNVAGVKGIGPKTAAELINQFGNLENIFANLDQIKQEKRRQILENGIESAKLSKQLISLREDVELGISDDDLKVKNIEPTKLISFLENQGFRSLVLRVQKEFNISENVVKNSTNLNKNRETEKSFKDIKKTKITSLETFDKLNKEAVLNGFAIIDYYKNGLLNLITISTSKIKETPEEIFYFEIDNLDKTTKNQPISENLDLFSFSEEKVEIESENKNLFQIDVLNKILFDDSIKKIFFNAKEFLKILDSQQSLTALSQIRFCKEFLGDSFFCDAVDTNIHEEQKNESTTKFIAKDRIFGNAVIYEDVSLINHLTTSSIKNNFFEIIEVNLDENLEELGFSTIFNKLDKLKEGKISEAEVFSDENKKFDFFVFKNFALWQIYKNFSPKIFDLNLNFAYHSFELPLLEVLAKMENAGIKIDVKKLKDLSDDFEIKIKNLTKEIYEIAGEEFNIASTQQLSKILFEKLSLNSSTKSKKTKALSTKSSVLEELDFEGHEIARKILEFRKFSKLKSTYTDSLPKEINSKTGKIHSHFSTTSTITGRFSSANPNLQNIPIKNIEGQKIRESFIASEGNFLISADYSQIELRVIAHVAKITNLIKAFKEGKDIHRITASQVLGIYENEVTDEMRSKAKAINFGIIYGISAFGLAKQLKISRQEAADYIKSYLEAYPGIESYMKEYVEIARKLGYVKTISGRKCFIHEINNKNPIIKSEAERLAINAPIQGSAADIIKKAMINLDKALIKENLQSKIILQIHDELIIEAPKNEVEIVSKIIKKEMENAVILDTPLKVDLRIEKFWQ